MSSSEAVFRIQIRIRIRLDPYHWAGSGSTSRNVVTDLGSQNKNRDILTYKSTKIKLNFILKKILFCLIYMNNKLKITKKKKNRYEI